MDSQVLVELVVAADPVSRWIAAVLAVRMTGPVRGTLPRPSTTGRKTARASGATTERVTE